MVEEINHASSPLSGHRDNGFKIGDAMNYKAWLAEGGETADGARNR